MMEKHIFLFGNWKMNFGPSAARGYGVALRELMGSRPLEMTTLALFPPDLSLSALREGLGQTPVALGVQDVGDHPSGAFTGQTSAAMALEVGCRYALVGHSERRHYQGESSDLVARKAALCAATGLTPVVCVGETLAIREAGETDRVVDEQLAPVRSAMGKERWIVAYEPVWAIGTGRAATADDAQAVCARITSSCNVPVLYGGSVNAANAARYFACPSIDGALVGGASLDPAGFLALLGDQS